MMVRLDTEGRLRAAAERLAAASPYANVVGNEADDVYASLVAAVDAGADVDILVDAAPEALYPLLPLLPTLFHLFGPGAR